MPKIKALIFKEGQEMTHSDSESTAADKTVTIRVMGGLIVVFLDDEEVKVFDVSRAKRRVGFDVLDWAATQHIESPQIDPDTGIISL